MNRVIVTIMAIILALSAVACSEEAAPAAQPSDPEPAAPAATSVPPEEDARLPVPPHGARGPGRVCFRASADEILRWKDHLQHRGVAIEADFDWPQGGHSIYFRDPAGNCLEFAEPRIWGL